MKKTIATAFTLLTLTTGVAFAQRGHSCPDNNRGSQYGNSQYGNSQYEQDEFREEVEIDRLDALVGLSRRQERELHRIEDNYDRQMATMRLDRNSYRQLQLRKRHDMLAVLTSGQRDQLFAAQQQQYGRRPYGGNGRRG